MIYEGARSCRNCLTFLEALNEGLCPDFLWSVLRSGLPAIALARPPSASPQAIAGRAQARRAGCGVTGNPVGLHRRHG
jgi:hypothetical protein